MFALALPLAHHAQSVEYVSDPWEVKVRDRWTAPDRLAQRNFRESQAWIDGLPVLGSMFQAKFRGDRLVLVSSDWWPGLVPLDANHTKTEMQALLEADMSVGGAIGNQGTTYLTDFGAEDLGMAWLPVKTEVEGKVIWEAHPTWQVEVTGRAASSIPDLGGFGHGGSGDALEPSGARSPRSAHHGRGHATCCKWDGQGVGP